MEIDHDPNDGKKFPNYGEKQDNLEKYGREATPRDFLQFILPILFVSISLFLWRNGWPF